MVGVLLTLYRFQEQALFNTTTLFRLDELLIGLSVGLLWHSDNNIARQLKKILSSINPIFIMIALAAASMAPPHPVLFVLRPYIAAVLIGALIYNQQAGLSKLMSASCWQWLSKHAYALYIIHPFLLTTWLASGDKMTMYMKRPLLFLVLYVGRVARVRPLVGAGWVALFFMASWGFAALPEQWLNGSLSYGSAFVFVAGMAAYHWRSERREPLGLALATLLFALSLTCRSLDMQVCDWLSMGTHPLWHLLNAGVLYLSTRALVLNEDRR